MPLTGAQLRAELGANAVRNVASPVGGGGQVVNVSITFAGVTFTATDLLDALEAKYGANKVLADTDTARHGVYRLRIIP
jgi:hypothetical protein